MSEEYLDKRFFIRRIDGPGKSTFDLALEIAEISSDCFYHNPTIRYWLGEDFLMREEAITYLNQTIFSPRERLRKFTQSAKNREKLLYSNAENIYRKALLLQGQRCYGVFDSKVNNRLVGVTKCIQPPTFGTPEKVSLSTKAYCWYLGVKFWIKDHWRFLFYKEHPTKNSRFKKIYEQITASRDLPANEPEELAKLALMNRDDIAKAPYPVLYMWYIADVFVSPLYQKQGIGKKMLKYCLDDIPRDAKPTFKSPDGVHESTGQLRIMLDSTDEGKRLYESFGFKDVGKNGGIINIDGVIQKSTPMVCILE